MSAIRARSAAWRALGHDEKVFSACAGLVALHLALVGFAQLSWPALVGVALTGPALWLFLRGGRAVRTLLAGGIGMAAAAAGLVSHVTAALMSGPGWADVTGVLVALAGLRLIVLAFQLPLRGTRRRTKLLAVPVALVLLQWFVAPLVTTALVANAPLGDVDPAADLGVAGARDVSFPARDGVRLAGWYAPGRNGAAVVVLHGSHGTRESTADHVRMLARAGYAVLAYDARGHGESAGPTNAYGWDGEEDVAGAVAFLRAQAGVDAGRIAALGLSMGGEEALRAAASGVPLAAVVADGAGASTSGDIRLVADGALPRSVTWTAMRGVELFTGVDEPGSLESLVGRIESPVLLVASNARNELRLDRLFARRIGARAQVWHLADSGHTNGLDERPAAYAARVQRFLRGALW